MKKLKIYLDNCCFNRPYDNQSQLKIALETEAKLYAQKLVKDGVIDLVWSYMLEYENGRNTSQEKMFAISKWRGMSTEFVKQNDEILQTAREIMSTGILQKDALHVACAIYANCDVFLSTDKRLLKYKTDKIKLCNPIEFLEVLEDRNND
jgi:predicted nucleic acid-binding protein